MTKTNSVALDDVFIALIGALNPAEQRNGLIDIVLDTAHWETTEDADIDGRAR